MQSEFLKYEKNELNLQFGLFGFRNRSTMNIAEYEIIRLANGLRCVFAHNPGVTYCGVAIGAGTRDEPSSQAGLAHFVEHTIFKGTENRPSRSISSRMECVGGELNAYTTKEETLVYTSAPSGYTERAMELLADLVSNCNFPVAEIEREKEVVIDEINSYLDSPAEAIFDEFEDLLYADSALGHNILGTPESVRQLTSVNCRTFVEKFYVPQNMVLYCAGEEDIKYMQRLAQKYFGSLVREPDAFPIESKLTPPMLGHFEEVRDMKLHQCHTLMGTRVFGRHDPRRFALFLLNNFLGGPAMNSVFNRELRDKRGYVYTVDSTVGLLSDCGAFQVYFGCDREHVKPCKRLVRRTIENLAETPMKPRVFEAALRQYTGQLQVAASYAESRAMNLGKSVLYYDKVLNVKTTQAALATLQPCDITEVAQLICQRGLNSLTLC